MSLEQAINQKLHKYPFIKKIIKRVYQWCMYSLSPKIAYEGDIIKLTPNDEFEYFFGYYDKSPWDKTNRYVLCLKVTKTWQETAPQECATIIVIDTEKNIHYEIAKTKAWNVQQGCMLQWLENCTNQIIFNDFRDNKYCSVILEMKFEEDNVEIVSERTISYPIYSVASNGNFALSLDFSRLHTLAPGYGYSNSFDRTKNINIPEDVAVWKIDLLKDVAIPLLKYSDFTEFESRDEMLGAKHKVNHIMLSPNNERFMILHRWFRGDMKYSRLVTCDIDGKNMYNLSDDNMVSHCFWKDNSHILAFENKYGSGVGYYLMKDQTNEYEHYWRGIDFDGHPSYSPDGNKIVFDCYPDKRRIASIFVSNASNKSFSNVERIVRVFAPFRYDNEYRCDLHPRWDRTGTMICFDAAYEGKRGLYYVKISE